MTLPIELEHQGSSDGHCDCCGTSTRRIHGLAYVGDEPVAAYYVGWTIGMPDHGATFDLIIGRWGDGAQSRDRSVVSLDFRVIDGKAQYMVVDAAGRLPHAASLACSELARSDVIGTPIAPQVFALVDAIHLAPETQELRNWRDQPTS